jgi:hypothetical protein
MIEGQRRGEGRVKCSVACVRLHQLRFLGRGAHGVHEACQVYTHCRHIKSSHFASNRAPKSAHPHLALRGDITKSTPRQFPFDTCCWPSIASMTLRRLASCTSVANVRFPHGIWLATAPITTDPFYTCHRNNLDIVIHMGINFES